MIEGLSHITFVCEDIDRMALILHEMIGAEQIYASDEKNFSLSREKFLSAGGFGLL